MTCAPFSIGRPARRVLFGFEVGLLAQRPDCTAPRPARVLSTGQRFGFLIPRGQSRLRQAGRKHARASHPALAEELGVSRSELGQNAATDDANTLQVGDPVGVHRRAGKRRRVGKPADRVMDREVGPQFLSEGSRRGRRRWWRGRRRYRRYSSNPVDRTGSSPEQGVAALATTRRACPRWRADRPLDGTRSPAHPRRGGREPGIATTGSPVRGPGRPRCRWSAPQHFLVLAPGRTGTEPGRDT